MWLWDCRHKPLSSNNNKKKSNGVKSHDLNEKVNDQEMSRAIIELFHWLYGMWYDFVETTYRPHRYYPISAERTVLSRRDIEHH